MPWDASSDRFTSPCHGSQFDKRAAVVLKSAVPKPLQLFHIDRPDNRWDPAHLEIRT